MYLNYRSCVSAVTSEPSFLVSGSDYTFSSFLPFPHPNLGSMLRYILSVLRGVKRMQLFDSRSLMAFKMALVSLLSTVVDKSSLSVMQSTRCVKEVSEYPESCFFTIFFTQSVRDSRIPVRRFGPQTVKCIIHAPHSSPGVGNVQITFQQKLT